MTHIIYENRVLVPLVHADGRLEARPYVWQYKDSKINDSLKFNPKLFPFILVHDDVEIEDHGLQGKEIKTEFVDILQMPHFIIRWNKDNLKEKIRHAVQRTYSVRDIAAIDSLKSEGATTMFVQSFRVDKMTVGFEYDFYHTSDYDPACPVCSQSTEILHTILDDWANEAIIVETDFSEQEYFRIKNTRKIVILKPSENPLTCRILEWYVENFLETIKLAHIEKIQFREYGTNITYEHIIDYDEENV